MIVLALGKKGSGKSALLRKLAWRLGQTARPPMMFYHDPQESLRPGAGQVFESVEAWRAAPAVPLLSVFRGVDVDELARLAIQVRDVTLVLDELDRAAVDKKWQAPAVRHIVHEGRHCRVSLWGTFRRTQNVPEDLLSQADVVFLFRHSRRAVYDVQMLDRRLGPDYAEAAQSLELGQFVISTDDD